MSARLRNAIAVATLLGCGGTTADLGDPPASDGSASTCVAFEAGKDMCAAKLGPTPDPRVAETAQAASELWRLTRQATLQIAWSCNAIASMNPTTPIPQDAPLPTAAEVEQACAAAKAKLRGIAPRVSVTFHTIAGFCTNPLCPAQGMAQCRAAQSRVVVEPATGAEVTLVERTVLLAALPVLDEAISFPMGDLAATATSTLLVDARYWQPSCAATVSRMLGDATALYVRSASAGVEVRGLLGQ
ncbi:MAG: hypothetical protein HOO96_36800 [Polyangiaceae bacterium]|nr:hypothetical protein [Polyangiaceae bacterium]